MSGIKGIQQKALSYVKKINIEREEYKNLAQKDLDGVFNSPTQNDAPRCDPADHRLGISNSFLIDHNLLQPLSFHIDHFVLLYCSLFVWGILMLAVDTRLTYFLYGAIVTFIAFMVCIFWLYVKALPQIDYRKALLEYYTSELTRIREVKNSGSFRLDTSSRKRKGWVYVTERYDKTTFKNSDLVLGYAILQIGTLTLYIIDEKCVLKPRLPLDSFSNLLKKMNSSQKLALDVSELEIKLVPDDLTMGRVWNKKFPIKLTVTNSEYCVLEVEAPVSGFIDLDGSCSEPFVIPSYHRNTPLCLDGKTLYLFGVSAREKERWYYKLISNFENIPSPDLTQYARASKRSNFQSYMEDATSKARYVREKVKVCLGANRIDECPSTSVMALSMFSLNMILSRLFWDFWREQSWNSHVLSRIQRTLDRILLPPFLKYLRADDLNLGDTLPLIFSAEEPLMDEDGGFWINCPIQYHGKFSLTIHTQIHHDLYGVFVEKGEIEIVEPEKGPIRSSDDLDSVLDMDSAEVSRSSTTLSFSTSGEPEVRILGEGPLLEKKGASRFKQNVAKMIQSNKEAIKLKAMDYAKKMCKSAANHFENSNLSLLVKLSDIKGTISVYFPPPPTNRVWYYFHPYPGSVLEECQR